MKLLIVPVVILLFLGIQCADEFAPPGEYGNHYQGDIVLTPEQKAETEGKNGRTGIINTWYRWPKSGGRVIVPFVIDGIYNANERAQIYAGMNEIMRKTCVSFVQRTNQANYIYIFSGNGCYSYMGKIGGRQDVSLQRNGCLIFGTIMHELIHALGYGHMQQHSLRDNYITVYFQNILAGAERNFEKLPANLYNNFGTNYDLISVMHYGRTAFTKNGQNTIVPKDIRYLNMIGQRSYLSAGDIARVRAMYQC